VGAHLDLVTVPDAERPQFQVRLHDPVRILVKDVGDRPGLELCARRPEQLCEPVVGEDIATLATDDPDTFLSRLKNRLMEALRSLERVRSLPPFRHVGDVDHHAADGVIIEQVRHPDVDPAPLPVLAPGADLYPRVCPGGGQHGVPEIEQRIVVVGVNEDEAGPPDDLRRLKPEQPGQ
jgi:hypothetical protein